MHVHTFFSKSFWRLRVKRHPRVSQDSSVRHSAEHNWDSTANGDCPRHSVPSETRHDSDIDDSSINITATDVTTHANTETSTSNGSLDLKVNQIVVHKFKFYQGGIRPRHRRFLRIVGRCGFVAKGVVYGIIGVLICTNVTGAWTPNGSQGNESPQGAFLLLGGIPAIGRPVLVVMAIGLGTYLWWRFWEAITGQGQDATLSRATNFFRYRLSPMISGIVYTAYLYYVIHMIFQTHEEQQKSASSNEFPASWTDSTVGSAFIGVFGVAFLIACITQLVNACTGNFIPDLKTSEPTARVWEARIVHLAGRIGFGARAAVFGTLSGFFWDSLGKRNESGNRNVVAAAIAKLSVHTGGKVFMMILGITLIVYALFAVANAHYKYFPTPPPSRIPLYALYGDPTVLAHTQTGGTNTETGHEPEQQSKIATWWRNLLSKFQRNTNRTTDVEKNAIQSRDMTSNNLNDGQTTHLSHE